MSIKTFTKPLIIVAASTALASGLGLYIYNEEHRPPVLEIYVFAPSSGRSMFIRTPEDKRILIDGSSNSEIIKELTSILPFYTRRIDMIMVTNTEGKNVSGLIDIIERYKVDQAFIPAFTLENLHLASSSDQIFSTFTDTLSRENIRTEQVSTGKIIQLDSKTSLEILFPVGPSKFAYSKASAPEILFNLKYGSNSFTFTGNASNKVQKYLASEIASTSSNSPMSGAFSFVSTTSGKQSSKSFPATSTTSNSSFGKAHSALSIKKYTDVLIVSHSALPANMSPQLIEKLKPEYLVYSRKQTSVSDASTLKATPNSKNIQVTPGKISTTKATTTKSLTAKSKKKEVVDPLAYIPAEKKFNLKEKGRVKIVSDGVRVIVTGN